MKAIYVEVLICPACGHRPANLTARHCEQCGGLLKSAEPSDNHYIGVPRGRSLFEIVFATVRSEFNNEDEAKTAAKTATWNDGKTIPVINVRHVRSVVPVRTHPFMCAHCQDQVAKTDVGKCRNCDSTEWKKRTS